MSQSTINLLPYLETAAKSRVLVGANVDITVTHNKDTETHKDVIISAVKGRRITITLQNRADYTLDFSFSRVVALNFTEYMQPDHIQKLISEEHDCTPDLMQQRHEHRVKRVRPAVEAMGQIVANELAKSMKIVAPAALGKSEQAIITGLEGKRETQVEISNSASEADKMRLMTGKSAHIVTTEPENVAFDSSSDDAIAAAEELAQRVRDGEKDIPEVYIDLDAPGADKIAVILREAGIPLIVVTRVNGEEQEHQVQENNIADITSRLKKLRGDAAAARTTDSGGILLPIGGKTPPLSVEEIKGNRRFMEIARDDIDTEEQLVEAEYRHRISAQRRAQMSARIKMIAMLGLMGGGFDMPTAGMPTTGFWFPDPSVEVDRPINRAIESARIVGDRPIPTKAQLRPKINRGPGRKKNRR